MLHMTKNIQDNLKKIDPNTYKSFKLLGTTCLPSKKYKDVVFVKGTGWKKSRVHAKRPIKIKHKPYFNRPFI